MYFHRQTFDFLARLAKHNDRQWFGEHREDYEKWVRTPALDFIEDFAGPLTKMAPHFLAIPTKVGGSLLRINRDTRFSKDKSPYKTNIGIFFRHHTGKDIHAPGFYLHIANDECFVGAGLWHPEPPQLLKIREAIAAQPQKWLEMVNDKALTKYMSWGGDSAVRMPLGLSPDHPAAESLKRKDFILAANLSREEVQSDGLIKIVADHYRRTLRVMEYLCRALEITW